MVQEDVRVLMVEDDEILAELISDYLQNCGITVEVNSDPTTVVEHLKKTTFDLIILDLTLPKMDGLFLCEQIKF
ncbi:MAG: response regulator [Sulfurimonas sp.]|uniref:response regulator transcription factor n=1 Tax=Sulfurimonas sp. TaxID=2022749 RepID=UPI0028CECE0A|nr:response regulator [Sulfurimonas sp.]MDT8338696.1 response regulator [Sulfurimonas sp.]